jgi:uncharacterized membrane protein (DUF4010 family)
MGVVAAILAWRRTTVADGPSAPGNPFEIGPVLRMAGLLAAIGALARIGAEQLGGAAVVAIAALTALSDVDAVTLSVPPLAPETITLRLAAEAVLVAVAVNIVAKMIYAAALGTRAFRRWFGLGSAIGLASGAAVVLLTLR